MGGKGEAGEPSLPARMNLLEPPFIMSLIICHYIEGAGES
jgi:hypothetical protein